MRKFLITTYLVYYITAELQPTKKSYSETKCWSNSPTDGFIQNIDLPTQEKWWECCNFWKLQSDSLNWIGISKQKECFRTLDTKLLNEDGMSYKQVKPNPDPNPYRQTKDVKQIVEDLTKYLEAVNFNKTRKVLEKCIDFSLFYDKLNTESDQLGCLCATPFSRLYLALDCKNSEGFVQPQYG